MKAAIHPQQGPRLASLYDYAILDTPRESDFDDIVQLASEICETPISVVNLIDEARQWFKAEIGLGVRETPLETSICAHAILESDFVEVPDMLADPRMMDNPLCSVEPGLRFYAGVLLKSEEGYPLGTLCVLDVRPRTLTAFQVRAMKTLARQVMGQLDLRRALSRQRILVHEIDHRVKNSLQSVASILRYRLRLEPQGRARDVLGDVATRVANISLLHEHLYRNGSINAVDAAGYLQSIAGMMNTTLPAGITITVSAEPVMLDSHRASAIGMLVSEFVSNSVKHAFPGRERGTISLRLARHDDQQRYVLSCGDDGVGLPADIGDAKGSNAKGIGMRIMQASAGQLGGTLETDVEGPGLTIRVVFSIPAPERPA